MRHLQVIVGGRKVQWHPGGVGFRGPLGLVVPALRAARESRIVRVGGARLRADGHSASGALVAILEAAGRSPVVLLTAPAECRHMLAWAYMLPADVDVLAPLN